MFHIKQYDADKSFMMQQYVLKRSKKVKGAAHSSIQINTNFQENEKYILPLNQVCNSKHHLQAQLTQKLKLFLTSEKSNNFFRKLSQHL